MCEYFKLFLLVNAFFILFYVYLFFSFQYRSKFKDIYDEEYFIHTLQNDVRIVDNLPDYIMERFGHNMSNVYNFKIKAWATVGFYKDTVLPKLLEEK